MWPLVKCVARGSTVGTFPFPSFLYYSQIAVTIHPSNSHAYLGVTLVHATATRCSTCIQYTAFLQYIFWKKHHGQVLPTSFFRSQKIERPNPRITEAMHLVRYTKARNMEACSKLLYIYAVANRHRNSTHSHRNTSHHLKQVKRKYLPRPDQHQFQDWW